MAFFNMTLRTTEPTAMIEMFLHTAMMVLCVE